MTTAAPMMLEQALDALHQVCPDARRGLGEPLFLEVSRLTPMVNVDLVIMSPDRRFLMTWRADNFYGPGWHIPGGIIRFKETMDQRIAAVAKDELQAQVVADPAPVRVFQLFNMDRDVRGHFITLAFRCKLTSSLSDQSAWTHDGPPQAGQWAWFDRLPENTISQHRVYKDLFDHLRNLREH